MGGISSRAANILENNYEFNGKEKMEKDFSDGSGLELYDFHARNFDPQIGRWHNLDPLSFQTPSVSPYVFVMNNPIMLIDPDGRIISGDTAMVAKLESAAGNIKKSEEARQVRLQKRIDKREGKGKNADRLKDKMSESKSIVSEIEGLLSDINVLRASTQEYHVNSNWTTPGDGTSGETNYNPTSKALDINVSSTYGIAGLAHELTHGAQFDRGLIDFKLNGTGRGLLLDITDEQSAFKRQFAINSGSLALNHIWQITDNLIRGLNAQYVSLPALGVNTGTSLHILFMFHRMANPNINYYPGTSNAFKSYKDAKATFFSDFISR